MKKLIVMSLLAYSIFAQQSAWAYVCAAPAAPVVATGGASGGFWASVGVFLGVLVVPQALVAAEANQVDWAHPLACAIFGDDARVGNEKASHCE